MKTPSSSRIVFAEDLGKSVSRWQPGAIGDGDRRQRDGGRRAADQPQADYDAGLRAGFEQGFREAHKQLAAAHKQQAEQFEQRAQALLDAFATQLAELQQSLADRVIALAVEIARSATGAALQIRSDAVLPIVSEALAQLVDERSPATVRLNPADADAVGERLRPLLQARGAQLVADASVAAGGCLIETPQATVDATLPTRWRRAIAALGRDDAWVDA
ncbi:MAG TPA: FliH/SctL family protein [Burkholderiaceae bacterium]|nr:FliH/SctL family protein [Burkholderiaceae bacterium]